MRRNLNAQVAKFLRKMRGELSYLEFSKKCGLSPMSLNRIELGEQKISLDKLEDVLNRLKLKVSDIFPDEF
jgi:transcriptional regulator with XRE-family HTH domain